MAAIEENWSELTNREWTATSLEKLYGRVREISESSSRFGLYQLNENVFSAEVYLSSFVGMEQQPATDQLEAIEGLLRNLRTAVASCSETEINPATPGQSIFLLARQGGETLAGLMGAFAAAERKVRTFQDTDSLLEAIKNELPVAIVADTSALPSMSPLSHEITRLKNERSVIIPLIFLSSSSNLQLRVEAIRAGSDAYFVAPFDAREIAQRVIQLSDQHAEKPFRIMVVEDDPTQAEFAASILRKAGMEVITVTEPMRVLDALAETPPDLILMDIYMPNVNGIELTTVIREQNEFVGIPIVFLSGEQDADKQMDALSVGGDDFIPKPIRPKHLLAVVESRVRRSRRMFNALGSSQAHDRLTGLLSRQRFVERVTKALQKAPAQDAAVGLLALGPDHTGELRDRLGMGGLDALMSELAKVIRTPLAENDAAAKLGEHVLGLLVKRGKEQQLHELAARLHESVAGHPFETGGTSLQVTIGVGICLLDERLDDPDILLRRAEDALEKAQQAGDDQTHEHRLSQEKSVDRESNGLTATIRSCLANDTFLVRYQPLLDLQSRDSENYEIALRMPAPSGDLLGERDIRAPAEQAGLAGDIDHWLLKRALAILKKRRGLGRKTHIFVRQSATSLLDPNLASWLLGHLRSEQMVGTGLVLDFRLSDLSQDIKAAQHNIAALRELNIGISLSRFPEKPAAFKVLRYVKADYISIAPRLLKAERDVISSVIDQSHRAGAKVIVSNIDDPRSIDLHWSSGADFLQGNFIQRPLDNMDYDFSQVVI
jgi:diguanylate cyclase (GGDEF)-like protein